MQYSSDFTKVMREAGYIYPFDWRRRRMDRDYEKPQGIRISVHCAEGFYFYAYNKLDAKQVLIKNVQRRKMKYENNDETVNS